MIFLLFFSICTVVVVIIISIDIIILCDIMTAVIAQHKYSVEDKISHKNTIYSKTPH